MDIQGETSLNLESKGEEIKVEPKTEEIKSEVHKEEPANLEEVARLAKGLQGGYTQTRQDIADIKEILQKLSEMPKTEKVEVIQGSDDYLTVGKAIEIFKNVLKEYKSAEQNEKDKKLKYINDAFDELYLQGVLKDKGEEEQFFALGQKLGIGDPKRLAPIWTEIKEAKTVQDKQKIVDDKKAKQEEADKIAKTNKSKSSSELPDVGSVRKTGWGDISKLFRNE